jgi:serine protease Do
MNLLRMRPQLTGRLSRRPGFARPFAALCLASLSALVVHGSELRHTAVVKAIEKNRAGIVNIHGQKTIVASADDPGERGDGTRRVNGMGTGVILDPRGYIVTNFHVVDGVKNIQVTLANEKNYIAQIISSDPKTDLAIIKITVPEPLSTIEIGTSSDLMIGEPVIAVGNAYGYEHTVTRGIVSALHRSVQVSEVQDYQDLIQTDASINPGNSGGPLLNIDGQMIGINVAVRAGAQGIGFAIPADRVMQVAANLMSIQRLDGNWHGVVAQTDRVATDGVLVKAVEGSSPAANGGLQPGDLIVRVDDREITRPLDLERAFLGHKPGDDIPVVVQRDQKSITLDLDVASIGRRAPASVESDQIWDVLGMKLSPMPATQLKQTQSRYRGGLKILSVRPDSPASRQGIRSGDVLVGMHVWETVSLENVQYVLNRTDFADIEPLKFYILRGNETLYGHLTVSSNQKAAMK